jgi:phosphoglycolate phosphatase
MHDAARLSGFRLAIFDYDGTLFDTRQAIVHCVGRTFEPSGRAIPARDIVADAVGTGATLPDTFLQLDSGLHRDSAALEDLVVTYRRLYRREGAALVSAFPGVAEMLHELHLNDIACAIVSNKGIEAIQRSLDATGLSLFIDFVVGALHPVGRPTAMARPRIAGRSNPISKSRISGTCGRSSPKAI